MRKLTSKKQHEKKQKRNQIIIGVILVVVMFGSVFGIITMNVDNSEPSGNVVEYNDYEFINQGTMWYLTIGERDFAFQYNPYQVQEEFNITIKDLKLLNQYAGMPLYINSQENINIEGEIARIFNGVSLRIQRACLNQENQSIIDNCDINLPLKDCSDNFIIVRTSQDGKNKIFQENNCVFIEGKQENLIKLADEYLFQVIGIK